MTNDPFRDGEEWAEINGFPRYMISTEGRIYNKGTNRYMSSSLNNYDHPKISLLNIDGRHTRSVAMLVAKAFLKKPNNMCDHIIYLNGEHNDCRSDNLAWRPRWFAWKYARQLKLPQPAYYRNLSVINVSTSTTYDNVVEAGSIEGLLFEQIWHSTFTGSPVFPSGTIWEVRG